MKYIDKIQSNLKNYKILSVSKRSTRVLDGSYKSVYRGRSMSFDELREYEEGDDLKDVDWNASARNRSLLVRQYVAEKKHNILIVFDTNKRMLGDTEAGEEKLNVGIMGIGTLSYLVAKNGDYIGTVYSRGEKIEQIKFRTGLASLETILQLYNKFTTKDNTSNINDILNYTLNNFNKRMIVIIVSDDRGIHNIEERVLKGLTSINDVVIMNITSKTINQNDKATYNLERGNYIPQFLSSNKRLIEKQIKLKEDIRKENKRKIRSMGIKEIEISSIGDIDREIVKILNRQ